ncbi:FtsW/RodA/SpoVE family cell cycle protein [Clostridium sp. YIM B02505]|uniref:FtsW/RodA/SpoVE family cell cycle protein n=1 Tax=Clostridium yunnanense TaxID=2800325 RepID=A0ABS1ES17_9CLOT|nr:FtsW/RodA/SpoVE family cell cycle protein [Clostridium yunnanense]MBK1812166.1 FtsW/RodA/SpoVE family cell cycle protein [Clostridium yunnanense]
MKLRLANFIPLIFAIPSVIMGVIAMYHSKVPTIIWAQNIGFLVVGSIISFFIVSSKYKKRSNIFYMISILICLLFLMLTFVTPSMNGVHRWLSLGGIRFNVSMIVSPILIITLWKMSKVIDYRLSAVITVVISALLLIQPDASELTGFAIPMMVILCSSTEKKYLRTFLVGVLSILVVLSWVFLDTLPPVTYVEGILNLVGNMGLVFLVLGIMFLIILPLPFILSPPKDLKIPSICIGLYFIIILTSTFFGNFPVPLMGYGISPIIGYFIAITWYAKSKINA